MSTSSLFGGRVRAGTLETLASTSIPLSAYHIAKVVGAEPIQVLSVLKALEPEIVRHDEQGWRLVSETLRRFVREDLLRREKLQRLEKDELLTALGFQPRRKRGSA